MLREILFQLILFLTNTIQTISGFAGTLLAMPFAIRCVGIEEAKAVINLFTLMACLLITIQNRKKIRYKILFRMTAGMILGMFVGIRLFECLSLSSLLHIYAVFIILIALGKMFVKAEKQMPNIVLLCILFGAGVIHGMFLSGGALLVVYAVTVLKDKDEFRATIAPVWVLLNTILIFSHYQQGYYNIQVFQTTACSILPLAASIILGNRLYKKIDQEHFLKLVYMLLIIAGVSLLI